MADESFSNPQLDPVTLQILRRNIDKEFSARIYGSDASVTVNFGYAFTARKGYIVTGITEVHKTAGTDGGTVTLQVEKCPSGTAPDSGTNLLATAFNLKSTANTPVHGTLITSRAELKLERGDSLVLKDSGTFTSVNDVCVTFYLREI